VINISHAQNNSGYVVYDWFQNMGLPYNSKVKLYFNDYESFYKELTKENSKQTKEESTTSFFNVNYEARESTYTNLKTRKIISQALVFTKAYVVEEDLARIQWQIFNEFQKVGKYNCQKAVGRFRGRTYEVWFTSEIPLNFGPWKLNGLPGLVLKVTESKGKILFDAVKIVINDSSQKNEIIQNIQIPAIGKKITLKEFVPLKDNEADDLLKFILSKEGRSNSSEIIKVEKAGRDFRYEVIYEWENKTANSKN
jgi:GLPGLI family protein